jgi:hypothetical protein
MTIGVCVAGHTHTMLAVFVAVMFTAVFIRRFCLPQVRVVDHRHHQLALVARPLTRPLLWGNGPRLVRHRLTLYAAVTRQIRALALGPRRAPGLPPAPHLAAAAHALADAATSLALAPGPHSRPAADVDRSLRAADAALLAARPAPGAVPPAVTHPLLHPWQLLRELSVQGPTPPPGPGLPPSRHDRRHRTTRPIPSRQPPHHPPVEGSTEDRHDGPPRSPAGGRLVLAPRGRALANATPWRKDV